MKKYLDSNNIRIQKNIVIFLKDICAHEKFKPNDLFVYIENGNLFAGFSKDENLHLEIHDRHWKPVHEC